MSESVCRTSALRKLSTATEKQWGTALVFKKKKKVCDYVCMCDCMFIRLNVVRVVRAEVISIHYALHTQGCVNAFPTTVVQ